MNRATAERRLAALGFEIDWSCTGKAEGYWSGVMDAIGRGMIDGDCRGEVVTGDTQADFLRLCIEIAESYAKHAPNTVCTDPYCDFHADHPIGE